MTYQGSCHCGAVKFRVTCDPITKGCRCNCKICRRKGAVVSDVYFTPDQMSVESTDGLSLYLYGDRMLNHWFCKTCGIHTFADPVEKPGHYRVNLGCLDAVDPFAVEIRLLDGASL